MTPYPYCIGFAHTSPSNEAFDADLRARDARWGVRDVEAVVELASAEGLTLRQRVAMTANNQCLVFELGCSGRARRDRGRCVRRLLLPRVAACIFSVDIRMDGAAPTARHHVREWESGQRGASAAPSSIHAGLYTARPKERTISSMAGDRDSRAPPPHCPLEQTCAMYDLFKLAGMQGLWQALYCHGTYQRCERFQTASLGKPVPTHLLPDGKLLQLTKRPPKG